MQGEFVDFLPLGVLLAPDEDAAVVRGAGEDGAVFRVSPGDAPYCSFVSSNKLVTALFKSMLDKLHALSAFRLIYVDHLQSQIF